MRKNSILLAIAVFVLIGGLVIMVIQASVINVKPFDVSDYQYYMETFPSEEILGNISNAKDAAKKAEKVWIKTYGESVKKERPYQVFYDAKNGVWLIQGCLKPNTVGGVSNVLIENNGGKVLAVWHDK